jgi:L-lactate dehydrogenase complex protein LldF
MKALGWVFRSACRYRWVQGGARVILDRLAQAGWVRWLPGYGEGWTRGRDFPAPAPRSFREWWREEEGPPEVRVWGRREEP